MGVKPICKARLFSPWVQDIAPVLAVGAGGS